MDRRPHDGADQNIEIDDPFNGHSSEDIRVAVNGFYNGLTELHQVIDVELLVKGAQLAKDFNARRDMQLSQIEVHILEEENQYKQHGLSVLRHQMEGMRVTIMTMVCAAAALGWQQSAINTSAQTWPEQFGLDRNGWKVSIINAAPSFAGSIIGTWVSDPLQGYTVRFPRKLGKYQLGRRFAMMLSGLVSVACCIWSSRCKGWRELLVCRVIIGIGFGTKSSVAPIFAAEAAMENSRGRILMLWQFFDAMGIALGFIVALIFRDSWEVQLGAALIPSLALMILVMLCPESPRFLIRNKRYAEAYKSLRRLRRLEIQAARDLYFIHAQLQQEARLWRPRGDAPSTNFPYQDYVEQQNSFKRMLRLFTHPRNRRACVVAFLVMISQQLCGINVLAYYSSNVFGNAASNNKVNWLSFGFGMSNLIFTSPAFFLIDTRGRRYLLLVSLLGMTVSLLLASFCFQINPEDLRVLAVVGTVIILFTAFYSIGAGPVPFTLSAEIFPLAFREVGMSFSVMVNFLGLGLLVLFVPRITRGWSENERIGQRNVLFLFTGLNFAMLVLVYLMVPKTERRTLEGMNDLFNSPTTMRIKEKFSTIKKLFYTATVRLGLRKQKEREETSGSDTALGRM